MSRGETRSNRSDIKTDGKVSKTPRSETSSPQLKREEYTQILKWMHFETTRIMKWSLKLLNLFAGEETRPFVIASARMINSDLGHNLWSGTSQESKRKIAKKIMLHSEKNFFTYKRIRLTYGILYRERKWRNGKRTSMMVRTNKKTNANCSSEYHLVWQMWRVLKGSDIIQSL